MLKLKLNPYFNEDTRYYLNMDFSSMQSQATENIHGQVDTQFTILVIKLDLLAALIRKKSTRFQNGYSRPTKLVGADTIHKRTSSFIFNFRSTVGSEIERSFVILTYKELEEWIDSANWGLTWLNK